MTDCSLAGQPYFSYVHACAYDKWAGGIRKKWGAIAPFAPPGYTTVIIGIRVDCEAETCYNM